MFSMRAMVKPRVFISKTESEMWLLTQDLAGPVQPTPLGKAFRLPTAVFAEDPPHARISRIAPSARAQVEPVGAVWNSRARTLLERSNLHVVQTLSVHDDHARLRMDRK